MCERQLAWIEHRLVAPFRPAPKVRGRSVHVRAFVPTPPVAHFDVALCSPATSTQVAGRRLRTSPIFWGPARVSEGRGMKRSGPLRPRVCIPVSTSVRSAMPGMPKARRRHRSARVEADAFDHRQQKAEERSESTLQLRGRTLEPMAQPPPQLLAEPAAPLAPGGDDENRSIAPADRVVRPSSQHEGHASHVEHRRSGADTSTTARRALIDTRVRPAFAAVAALPRWLP